MSIVNAKEMLIDATKGKYAVGAFNITSLVQLEAVVDAAVETKSPVIIQTSVKPSQFYKPAVMVAIYRTLAESAPVPVCLHLDHCTDVAYCKTCADAGYTNIMIDASKQAFEENIRQTKEIVDYCHKHRRHLRRRRAGHGLRASRTRSRSPRTRRSWPIPSSRSNSSSAPGWICSRRPSAPPTASTRRRTRRFDFDRLEKDLPDAERQDVRTPLVVHGGTGLPREYVERLIAMGGSKFNVSTELKYTLIDTTNEYLQAHRDEYDPGKIDSAVRDATRKAVIHWMEMLKSPGKA